MNKYFLYVRNNNITTEMYVRCQGENQIFRIFRVIAALPVILAMYKNKIVEFLQLKIYYYVISGLKMI